MRMIRKLVFTTAIFILTISLLELSSRWLENNLVTDREEMAAVGWQARFFGQILDWHEPDPDLLWKFKPNLNGRLIQTNSDGMLIGDRPTDPNVPAYKILLLGDSSPVGLGLSARSQAFGEQLEGLLEIGFKGRRDIRLFNAAVSGYSSAQIVRQAKRLLEQFSPDLVLVYCGNNDASISGYRSDSELLEGQRLTGIRRIAEKLAIYRLMRSLIQSTADRSSSEADLTVRVTPEQYGENLEALVELCRTAHAPLIVIKPPVPLLWPAGLQFKPFLASEIGQSGMLFPEAMAKVLGRKLYYCIDPEQLSEIYAGVDLFTRMVYETAEPISDSLARQLLADQLATSDNQQTAVELNNLGVACWKEGLFAKGDSLFEMALAQWQNSLPSPPDYLERASGAPICYNAGINRRYEADDYDRMAWDSTAPEYALLDSALQLDFFSLRIKRAYCEQLDSLSGLNAVYLVDPAELFAANGGERLFIDHCHPTAEGHHLIARQLAELIVAERLIR